MGKGKREKSPEVGDDARYFTIYQPYPLNANWLDDVDQQACALWIAECIGQGPLWAIYEKPKARNMILVEVAKAFENHASLLGEHRWSEFLKDPTAEEKERVTQVFHSFYATSREAQKDGWKTITISAKWFDDWVPGAGRIKRPYPNTHWCLPPHEDKTNKILCRPLPVEQKAPPPRAPPVVVGSSTWVAKQVEPPPSKAALASAWSAASSQIGVPEARQSVPSSPAMQPSSPISSGANTPVLPAPQSKSRGRPVPLQQFVIGAVKANAKKTGWAPIQPTHTKANLAESQKGPMNAWNKPLKVPQTHKAKVITPVEPDISQWGGATAQIDHGAWLVEDTPKDDINDLVLSAPPPAGSWPPSSPKQTRTQDPALPKKIRSDKGNSKGAPVAPPEKRPAWGAPTPEQSTKHLPKPWDKEKKTWQDTVQTIFPMPLTDVRNRDSPASPEGLDEFNSEYEDDGRGGEDKNMQHDRRGKPGTKPLVRIEELVPGRSLQDWDHSGFDEIQLLEADNKSGNKTRDGKKGSTTGKKSAGTLGELLQNKGGSKGTVVESDFGMVPANKGNQDEDEWGADPNRNDEHEQTVSNAKGKGKQKQKNSKKSTSGASARVKWGDEPMGDEGLPDNPWDDTWGSEPGTGRADPSDYLVGSGQSSKSKGKGNEEDEGTIYPERPPSAQGSNWGSIQGGTVVEWASLTTAESGENLEIAALHPYERDTFVDDMDDWGPADPADPSVPPAQIPAPNINMAKGPKCPTHNIQCKKSICKDMARFIRQEEAKERDRLFNERKEKAARKRAETGEGSGQGWKPPHRPKGQMESDTASVGRLRGFDNVGGGSRGRGRYNNTNSTRGGAPPGPSPGAKTDETSSMFAWS